MRMCVLVYRNGLLDLSGMNLKIQAHKTTQTQHHH